MKEWLKTLAIVGGTCIGMFVMLELLITVQYIFNMSDEDMHLFIFLIPTVPISTVVIHYLRKAANAQD